MPIDDLLREQSCESQPVCMCIAEEPVIRILGEIFLEASGFLLHIHAPVAEHVAQDIGNNFMKAIPFSFLQPHCFRREPTLKSQINRVMELKISCSLSDTDGTIDMVLLL